MNIYEQIQICKLEIYEILSLNNQISFSYNFKLSFLSISENNIENVKPFPNIVSTSFRQKTNICTNA